MQDVPLIVFGILCIGYILTETIKSSCTTPYERSTLDSLRCFDQILYFVVIFVHVLATIFILIIELYFEL